MSQGPGKTDRRSFVRGGLRVLGGAGVVGFGGVLAWTKGNGGENVWQIDPHKCVACGNCATYCVLDISAVKCVHSYGMCGYCELCTGFFDPEPIELTTGAHNQLCPTGAILRHFVEEPYYEYTIDRSLCIGCGKCVKGCSTFGNGSLYLQIAHDRCVHCNECAISVACPSQAIVRVSAARPYLLKHEEHKA
jgi:electron transport complex protein RnfB